MHSGRVAMACRFEVTLPEREPDAVRISREALDKIDQIESQLTVFRDTSEISYINRHAGSAPVRAERSLYELLEQCMRLSSDTDGAFDVTAGPLVRCWGFLKRQGRFPEPDEIASALSSVGMRRVMLDPAAQTVKFASVGVEVNFGAIGKGFALDCAAAAVRRQGSTSALLSGGGSSIIAIGDGYRHGGWSVGVKHPAKPGSRLAVLSMRDCAMATSGGGEQYFEIGGKRYCHIIDPRSGWPATGLNGATVIAKSAAVADALSTAFFIGGPQVAERYCGSHSEVMVILYGEQTANKPLILGSNSRCNVELISR